MGRESTGTSGAEMESEPIVLGHASGSVLGSASGPCRGTRAKNATHLPAARIAVPARNPQAAPNKPHLGTKHQTRATVRMPPNAPIQKLSRARPTLARALKAGIPTPPARSEE